MTMSMHEQMEAKLHMIDNDQSRSSIGSGIYTISICNTLYHVTYLTGSRRFIMLNMMDTSRNKIKTVDAFMDTHHVSNKV